MCPLSHDGVSWRTLETGDLRLVFTALSHQTSPGPFLRQTLTLNVDTPGNNSGNPSLPQAFFILEFIYSTYYSLDNNVLI